MSKLLKFSIFAVVGLAGFAIIIWKVGLENIEQAIKLFFNLQGLALVLLTLLVAFFSVLKWQVILKSQGIRISLKELSLFWFAGFAVMYLAPFALFGGEVARAYLLRKKFPEISWEKSSASVAVDKILDATVFFIFMVGGMLAFSFFNVFVGSVWSGGAVLVAGAFLFLLVLFYFKRYKKESVLEWLMNFFSIRKEHLHRINLGGEKNDKGAKKIFKAEAKTFRFFSLKRKRFWQALFLTLLRYFASLARAGLLLYFLVGSLDILKALAVFGFASLASLAPLPASLGALELSQGFAFQGLGFDFSAGTVFSLLWRASDIVLCLLGGIFAVKIFADILKMRILGFFIRENS